MNPLIRFSLNNWYAVVVAVLTIGVLGVLALAQIPRGMLQALDLPPLQFQHLLGAPRLLADQLDDGVECRLFGIREDSWNVGPPDSMPPPAASPSKPASVRVIQVWWEKPCRTPSRE